MSSEKEPQGREHPLAPDARDLEPGRGRRRHRRADVLGARGSLIATAITPIIVAIVSEALNRPAKVITAAAPKVTRRSATGAALRSEQPTGVGARGGGPEQLPPRREDPFGLYEEEKPRRRFPWRLAVITGLLAAVIGAGVVTASELAVFGHQIGNTQRSTGLLGGKSEQEHGDPDGDGHADRDRGRRRDADADRDRDRDADRDRERHPDARPPHPRHRDPAPQLATPTATPRRPRPHRSRRRTP